MADSRLSQGEIDGFITKLQGELPSSTLEKGPSIRVNGCRLWLTLLDDASGGQLRVRKLVMTIVPEGGVQGRRSREWFSTSPLEDRWTEIDRDQESTSDEVLALVKAEFVRVAK